MIFLLIVFVLLMFFPVIVAYFFKGSLVDRKEREILADLQDLKADQTDLIRERGGMAGIRADIERYHPPTNLMVSAAMLSFLYVICFFVIWDKLNVFLSDGSPVLFSDKFLSAIRPVMMAFVGVYLFNLGSTIRRLYLSDLTEHVFWSAANRLLLTIGLAVLIATAFGLNDSSDEDFSRYYYFLFFAIGFIANEYLQWAVDHAVRLLKIRQSQTPDLPLRTVQGINIWKEYRLQEEGIENVQNLATADVIALAFKTHFSLRTLVDWIDQAILIDRLGDKARELRGEGLIAGAIDFAWQSPKNSGSDASANLIGAKLKVDPHFVGQLMNNLFEDAHVRTLWELWETRSEVPPPKVKGG